MSTGQPYSDQRFADFVSRDEALKKINRYSGYATMFYRTNLLSHGKHLAWLVNELAPVAQLVFNSYNPLKAELMALVHDDPEIITGDFQASYRTKLSDDELAEQKNDDLAGIKKIAERFPDEINGYRYQQLLEDYLHLNSNEALVVKYCDKLDGFCEALHEYFAGNIGFLINPIFRGQPVLVAFDYYLPIFEKWTTVYPAMARLFEHVHPLLIKPEWIDIKKTTLLGSPHTRQSLDSPSGYPLYDAWKKVIINNATDEELLNLYTQKEFLPR